MRSPDGGLSAVTGHPQPLGHVRHPKRTSQGEDAKRRLPREGGTLARPGASVEVTPCSPPSTPGISVCTMTSSLRRGVSVHIASVDDRGVLASRPQRQQIARRRPIDAHSAIAEDPRIGLPMSLPFPLRPTNGWICRERPARRRLGERPPRTRSTNEDNLAFRANATLRESRAPSGRCGAAKGLPAKGWPDGGASRQLTRSRSARRHRRAAGVMPGPRGRLPAHQGRRIWRSGCPSPAADPARWGARRARMERFVREERSSVPPTTRDLGYAAG